MYLWTCCCSQIRCIHTYICLHACMALHAYMPLHEHFTSLDILQCILYLSDRPLRPVMDEVKPSDTTLSLTWMHNNVCFKDCTVYNISWSPPFTSSIVNGTNYTIDGLQPGQTYSVQVCAVCEGYLPNCTQTQPYTTGEMHADTHTVHTVPIYLRTCH